MPEVAELSASEDFGASGHVPSEVSISFPALQLLIILSLSHARERYG
jgi:hypothetical protein